MRLRSRDWKPHQTNATQCSFIWNDGLRAYECQTWTNEESAVFRATPYSPDLMHEDMFCSRIFITATKKKTVASPTRDPHYVSRFSLIPVFDPEKEFVSSTSSQDYTPARLRHFVSRLIIQESDGSDVVFLDENCKICDIFSVGCGYDVTQYYRMWDWSRRCLPATLL